MQQSNADATRPASIPGSATAFSHSGPLLEETNVHLQHGHHGSSLENSASPSGQVHASFSPQQSVSQQGSAADDCNVDAPDAAAVEHVRMSHARLSSAAYESSGINTQDQQADQHERASTYNDSLAVVALGPLQEHAPDTRGSETSAISSAGEIASMWRSSCLLLQADIIGADLAYLRLSILDQMFNFGGTPWPAEVFFLKSLGSSRSLKAYLCSDAVNDLHHDGLSGPEIVQYPQIPCRHQLVALFTLL